MSLSVQQLAKPLKVLNRIQETAQAISLILEIPAALKTQFHYQAGQFVTFFLNINGEELSRSYSISSSPLVDNEFQVTVKKIAGGRGSTFLCENIKIGDTLMTTPPSGHFFKPALNAKGTHYFLFSAGSGITPIYSIMKTVLNASTLNHVSLIYCNHNEDSIIYRKELEQWAAKFPTRLDVVHVLSKPASSGIGRSGRIDRPFICEFLETPHQAPQAREFYLCGPVEFMHVVRNTLLEFGIAKDLVKEENFGVTVHRPHAPLHEGYTLIGPDIPQADEYPQKIVAQINGETIEVAATVGKSILETLLEAGKEPPYSCMDGACMACMAKVQSGRVYQEDPGILSDDNINNHEALTCQAKPLSSLVKISYDNL